MTEIEVLKIFKTEKALLTGHFLLSSGLHSPNYMQCALLLQKPRVAEKLCKALAKKVKGEVDVVIGPAMGGIVVSYEMGRALKVRSIFSERVDGTMNLRRGFALRKNEKVLVVEDVVTTGKSSREVIELIRQNGGKLVGVACMVDRSEKNSGFDVPLYSLIKMDIKTYDPARCPLCRDAKIPVIKPGSRAIK